MMSLVLLGPCYRSPSKSFGELFEEKKSKLDALQATLAEAVMPKFPPMPAVKYSDIGFGIDLHKGVMPDVPLVPVPNVSIVFDIIGAVFAGISSVLPEPPAPPPVAEGEEPAELGFCESVEDNARRIRSGLIASMARASSRSVSPRARVWSVTTGYAASES